MLGLCALPLQARLGLLFPFLPFICPPVLSPAWMGWFSLIQVRRCHGFVHSCPTRPQQGLFGASLVLLPYSTSKNAHRATQGRVWFFSSKTSLPLPPKGGGAGYRLSWVGRVCPARSQPGHVGPTGPVWCCAGVVSLPCSLTGHKSSHRAEFGFHRFFFLDFLGGSPASWRSRW